MDEKKSKPIPTHIHPDQLPHLGARAHEAAPLDVVATPDEPTELCRVAEGRTIHIPTGKRSISGYDTTEGKYVYRTEQSHHGPGSEVTLPVSEAKRLRELGFIFDPNKVAPPDSVFDAQKFQNTFKPGAVPGNGTGQT